MLELLLDTNRLTLRRFKENDALDLYDYLSKDDVVKFEPYELFTYEEAVKEAISRINNPSFIGVELKTSRTLIGNIYINKLEPHDFETWEIGYVFNSDYHSQGYATESVIKMINHLFYEYNAHRIIALCNVLNKPAWKLLERLGFRREGHSLKRAFYRRDKQHNPIWHDVYEYALLKEENKNSI